MQSRSRRPVATVVVLACVLFVVFLATRDDGPPPTPPIAPEVALLARERAATHFAREELVQAREALRPLLEGREALVTDLIHAAAIEVADNEPEAARGFLDRAAKHDARNPAIHYLLGQLAYQEGDAQTARAELLQAQSGAPNDLATRLALAEAAIELGDEAEAERLFRSVVEVGLANGEVWYVSAVYRLSNLLTRAGTPDKEAEAARLDIVRRQLEARGIRAPNTVTVLVGSLARPRPPQPAGTQVAQRPAPNFAVGLNSGGLGAHVGTLLARDIDGDRTPDLFALGGTDGSACALQVDGGFRFQAIADAAAPEVSVPFDVENDGDLDLLTLEGGQLVLHLWQANAFARAEGRWPAIPATPASIVAVDYDHEGDLDLVLAGPFGARIWRNDSAIEREKDGTNVLKSAVFADASADSGLPSASALTWCVPEDYDGDQDVDLLFGGADGVVLCDSLRDGKFAEKRGAFALASGPRPEPLVADLDGDARPDLWFSGSPSILAISGKRPVQRGDVKLSAGTPIAADFDLDGSLDVAWLASDGTTAGVKGIFALALAEERHLTVAGEPLDSALATADFDGDRRVDLISYATHARLSLRRNEGPTGRGVRVTLLGTRDNRRGVGATVEYRAGGIYRRVRWRGEPEILGTGDAQRIDVLRVTWPNGVVTTRLDVEDTDLVVEQGEGLIGSCPFLYSWNGREYVFVTDVLGITPLGLRMAPGMLVPPDHDEYVLVTGEQLAPKDGELVLQLTEELREVTYLDHARLLAVDSPQGTEVYPNERFQFPPFPEHHIHTVRDPIAPARALGSDGRDWTAELRANDDAHAQPMELQAQQYAGLARPWFLELEFDRARVAAAQKLRLVMTGWFSWSDASANMSSARTGTVAFVPPILQVPDGKGGWRDAGPPVGFPAGKTKTMVVEVGAILDRADPRLRIATTLRLYWDRIVLATDGDDAPLEVRELACSSAVAFRRGFSAPLAAIDPGEADPQNAPERFDWNVLAEPRWNQHPGLYTRYGECRELVDAIDDRFVILGAGDALTLRFDARALPPPAEGMRRDWLLFLDGWAKDRDPNTLEALEVDPLPFHGMSGYPYRPDERFPDGEAHRAWQRTWRTRPAFEWVAPISPVREAEWLHGGG